MELHKSVVKSSTDLSTDTYSKTNDSNQMDEIFRKIKYSAVWNPATK